MEQILALSTILVVVAANFGVRSALIWLEWLVGGDANPARTGVALPGFILDELKTPRALSSPAGGLKIRHSPLFGSCD